MLAFCDLLYGLLHTISVSYREILNSNHKYFTTEVFVLQLPQNPSYKKTKSHKWTTELPQKSLY